jgi:hypothetical protein
MIFMMMQTSVAKPNTGAFHHAIWAIHPKGIGNPHSHLYNIIEDGNRWNDAVWPHTIPINQRQELP